MAPIFIKKGLARTNKNKKNFENMGVHFFNVRGRGLQTIGDNDIFFDESGSPETVKLNLHKSAKELIRKILHTVDLQESEKVKAKEYLNSSALLNTALAIN